MIKLSILSIVLFGNFAAAAGKFFAIHCSKKGGLNLQKSETWLRKASDGTFEAEYRLQYKGQESEGETFENLTCEFNHPVVHCWNKDGQAFNFSEKRTTAFDFDHYNPKKFQPSATVEYNTTFMFHAEKWEESGPAKYQHMPYAAGACTLKK